MIILKSSYFFHFYIILPLVSVISIYIYSVTLKKERIVLFIFSALFLINSLLLLLLGREYFSIKENNNTTKILLKNGLFKKLYYDKAMGYGFILPISERKEFRMYNTFDFADNLHKIFSKDSPNKTKMNVIVFSNADLSPSDYILRNALPLIQKYMESQYNTTVRFFVDGNKYTIDSQYKFSVFDFNDINVAIERQKDFDYLLYAELIKNKDADYSGKEYFYPEKNSLIEKFKLYGLRKDGEGISIASMKYLIWLYKLN